jgi:RNA polymerase sigma factor (sigma-70 family)
MAMLPVQAPSEQGPVSTTRPHRSAGAHRGLASRSDERLVAVAKEGDERAFAILYERHSPAILRYCRSILRSAQEAEDVKQEAFVLAMSALRRGAEPDAFRPWLYRVAHNACMSHLRVRRPVLVADNGVLVGPAGAAAPVDTHREELRQLIDDIGTLPEVQRGALLLREMDGFSYEQVGEVLGLPLSTVRASIFRARRTLQGLADARDADCDEIQSELSRLAYRRGRRGRHITSHLHVCANCREFRDGLRRRPSVLGAITPAGPFGLLVALKGKLLGGAAAGGGAGAALVTGGGGAGVAKIAAVAASSIALLAGAGIEADQVIDNGRRDAAATPRHVSATPAPPIRAARGRATAATAGGAAVAPAITAADRPLREGRLVVSTPRTAGAGHTGARAHAREHGRPDASASGGHRSVPATAPGSTSTAAASNETGERHHEGASGPDGHGEARGDGRAGTHHSDDASEGASGGGRHDDDAPRGRGRERTAPTLAPTPGTGSGGGTGPNGPAEPADDTSHASAPSSGGSGAPATTPGTSTPTPAPQSGTTPPASSGSGSGSGSTTAPAPSSSGPGSAPEDPTVGGSTVDPLPAPAEPTPAAPAAPATTAGGAT